MLEELFIAKTLTKLLLIISCFYLQESNCPSFPFTSCQLSSWCFTLFEVKKENFSGVGRFKVAAFRKCPHPHSSQMMAQWHSMLGVRWVTVCPMCNMLQNVNLGNGTEEWGNN